VGLKFGPGGGDRLDRGPQKNQKKKENHTPHTTHKKKKKPGGDPQPTRLTSMELEAITKKFTSPDISIKKNRSFFAKSI